jgi:hypothetical protein
MRYTNSILVGNPQMKRAARRWWEDLPTTTFKIYFREIGCKGMDWIN